MRSPRILSSVRQNWFLLGILAAVWAAWVWPQLGVHGGPLRPEWTVKVFCVFLIFLLSGVSVQTSELVRAVMQWRLHVLVQCFTFLLVPAFVHLASPLALRLLGEGGENGSGVLSGLTTLSCMPPPVSSAVILTRAVGGNEAAAVFNSALGSVLGVFVTPALLLKLVGVETSIPASAIVSRLFLTVVVPLFLGQLIRGFFVEGKGSSSSKTRSHSWMGQIALLLIIYSTFCEAFSSEGDGKERLDFHRAFVVIFIVILFQICAMSVLFSASNRLRYLRRHLAPQDVACLVFCGVHKSLTLGMPILNVLYADSPDLPLICLPLLAYHPTQILLGGILAPYYKNYIRRKSTYGTDVPVV